jgi:hypothetical protein
LHAVGLSTVCRTMNRLGPVLRKIRRKQGNRDPNSPWAKAIQRWVTQLLVRLGKHEFNSQAPENQHLGLPEHHRILTQQSAPVEPAPTGFFLMTAIRNARLEGPVRQFIPFPAIMMECTARGVILQR